MISMIVSSLKGTCILQLIVGSRFKMGALTLGHIIRLYGAQLSLACEDMSYM